MSNFIVLSHARSGSTWLVNTLNNVPGVHCYGELFREKANYFVDRGLKVERFPLWREKNPGKRPLATFQYIQPLLSQEEIVGFKLMYGQLFRYPELAAYVIVRRLKIIHLFRRNALQGIISYKIAKERGQFHYRGEEYIPQTKPIVVNAREVVSQIRSMHSRSKMIDYFLRFAGPHVDIAYEDLATNQAGFRPIWQLLGLDFEASPPQWQMKQARTTSLRDTISNYSELADALSAAGYSSYLDSK
ncbi:MAG: hypothetical protein KF698_05705 [Anaerolineales bacterium]|nr:hypothetical protein [Anaerolineales bacterium]